MAQTAKPTNGFDKNTVRHYVEQCEQIAADASSQIGKAMQQKKEKTDELLEEAKSEGIPGRPLKALLRRRESLRKVDEATAKLNEDDLASYDAIAESLGDWAEEVSARS